MCSGLSARQATSERVYWISLMVSDQERRWKSLVFSYPENLLTVVTIATPKYVWCGLQDMWLRALLCSALLC